MSEEQAFARRICETPADDTVRLIFADWLQDRGDDSRANFIRRQIAGELATLRMTWLIPFEPMLGIQPHRLRFSAEPGRAVATVGTGRRLEWTRGFLSRLECPAHWWLQWASDLAWRPGWETACGSCRGSGTRDYGDGSGNRPFGELWGCTGCGGRRRHPGTGRVPRPCPPTAQPIETVALTTHPDTMTLYRLCRETGFGESPGNRIDRHVEILEAKWSGITFTLPR